VVYELGGRDLGRVTTDRVSLIGNRMRPTTSFIAIESRIPHRHAFRPSLKGDINCPTISPAVISTTVLRAARRPRRRNASKKKPTKLLAMFRVDTNETELTIPFGI